VISEARAARWAASDKVRSMPVSAWIGIAVLVFWVAVALLGPSFAPHGEAELLVNDSFAQPGVVGFLGGDYLGRDVLSRLAFGAQRTLGLAGLVTVTAFALGVGLGFLAAIAGGWTDALLSRLNDALMAFPSLILALVVIAALGSSIPVLFATVTLIDATRIFRVARSLAMDILVMDFVDAARARGEGAWWIMRSEVAPNALPPLAAEFGIRYTYAILFISALSFLGLGIQPPNADWGVMVRENLQGLLFGSLAPLYPAAAIATVTVAINLVVDGMLQGVSRDLSDEPAV
jgi:peptide/nickel transport system permease protein